MQTQVTGLNDKGVTVGFWSSMNNASQVNDNHGFYEKNGKFHTADFPAGSPAAPPVDQLLGVNNTDVAVGSVRGEESLQELRLLRVQLNLQNETHCIMVVVNTYFLAKDARKGIDEEIEGFGRPELLLLDPPRLGAGGKVMRRIGRSKPERIIYVSCNPDTFAADIKELSPFGYELEVVQPVDLFPHTVHVECVAKLVLKEGN